MQDFLFSSGWGAFSIMLMFQIPFVFAFIHIIYRKLAVDTGPSNASPQKYSRIEAVWILSVIALFITVNAVSISYMPPVSTAQASTGKDIQQVDVTARSWFYDISERTYEVDRPVEFSAKALDTIHGFAVYHPDGRVLFTMMLMPGVETPTSLIYTFTDPGTYTVRCLEYCGIGHHHMRDQFTVVDSSRG